MDALFYSTLKNCRLLRLYVLVGFAMVSYLAETSARLRPSASKLPPGNVGHLAALADTTPNAFVVAFGIGSVTRVTAKADYSPASANLTGHILSASSKASERRGFLPFYNREKPVQTVERREGDPFHLISNPIVTTRHP